MTETFQPVSDQDALRRWAARKDERALEWIVQRHGGRVYGTALRALNGDVALAEDAAQAVFTVMARKAARLVSHPSLAAWLHRAAMLEASYLRRREATHRHAQHTYAAMMATSHSSESDSPRPDLDDALERLPASDRVVLIQRFYEALSFADIAARLGKTEAAVRKQCARALAKMERLLRRRGVVVSAAGLGTVLASYAKAELPAKLALSLPGHAAAGATTLPALHSALHSFALMTYGHKTGLTAAALVLVLLSLGGSYALGLVQARHAAAASVPRTAAITSVTSASGPSKPDTTVAAPLEATFTVLQILDAVAERLRYNVRTGTHGASQPLARELAAFKPEFIPEALARLAQYHDPAQPDDSRFEAVAGVVFAFWAATDLEAAKQALPFDEFRRVDGKIPAHALRVVAEEWAKTEPVAALQWMLHWLDTDQTPFEPQRGSGMEAALFQQWLEVDPGAALREMNARTGRNPEMIHRAVAAALHSESGRSVLRARLAPSAQEETQQEAVRLLQNHLRWMSGNIITNPGGEGTTRLHNNMRIKRIMDQLQLEPTVRDMILNNL